MNTRKRIGKLLIEKQIITHDQLMIALLQQQREHKPLGKIIVQLGFTSEAIIRDCLSESLGHTSIDLVTVVPEPQALALVPVELARHCNAIPIALDDTTRTLSIAIEDIYNLSALDKIRHHINRDIHIEPLLAAESEINIAIDQFYGYALSIDDILQEIENSNLDYENLHTEEGEYSQPLVRLVDAILADAVKQEASDIHLEPENGFFRLRYRIDGVLKQIRALHKDYWPAIVVRIKVMANIDISESRAPQDGHISLTINGRPIDFRVSVQPTLHGENFVLRILDSKRSILSLEKLGLSESVLQQLKRTIARPQGIVLVTGPTGSGKTTTLYSLLNHISKESVNIMTLEDPVEYPMELVRQASINQTVKMDFASGIRSILRQDPDIVLIGEIRDEATANMAFRAAMTGHQVYSTLHTNCALGAIARLLDIGILPHILAGNIIGVIAQRLLRRLCPHCKKPYQASAEVQTAFNREEPLTLHRAVGCDKCDKQGYKGRFPILEILRINSELDELIAKQATRKEIETSAYYTGFRPMAKAGIERVMAGETSLEELYRVIDLTEFLP